MNARRHVAASAFLLAVALGAAACSGAEADGGGAPPAAAQESEDGTVRVSWEGGEGFDPAVVAGVLGDSTMAARWPQVSEELDSFTAELISAAGLTEENLPPQLAEVTDAIRTASADLAGADTAEQAGAAIESLRRYDAVLQEALRALGLDPELLRREVIARTEADPDRTDPVAGSGPLTWTGTPEEDPPPASESPGDTKPLQQIVLTPVYATRADSGLGVTSSARAPESSRGVMEATARSVTIFLEPLAPFNSAWAAAGGTVVLPGETRMVTATVKVTIEAAEVSSTSILGGAGAGLEVEARMSLLDRANFDATDVASRRNTLLSTAAPVVWGAGDRLAPGTTRTLTVGWTRAETPGQEFELLVTQRIEAWAGSYGAGFTASMATGFIDVDSITVTAWG